MNIFSADGCFSFLCVSFTNDVYICRDTSPWGLCVCGHLCVTKMWIFTIWKQTVAKCNLLWLGRTSRIWKPSCHFSATSSPEQRVFKAAAVNPVCFSQCVSLLASKNLCTVCITASPKWIILGNTHETASTCQHGRLPHRWCWEQFVQQEKKKINHSVSTIPDIKNQYFLWKVKFDRVENPNFHNRQ